MNWQNTISGAMIVVLLVFNNFSNIEAAPLGDWRFLTKLTGHQDKIRSIALSPNNKYIVTGSNDKLAIVWDFKGSEIHRLRGHTGNITSISISPDSSFVVTGSSDQTARIWNLQSGALIAKLEGHQDYINNVAVSSNNKFIVTTSADTTLRIWDANNGKLFHELIGHTDYISNIAISSDNSFIVSGSIDHSLRIWDVKSGTQRKQIDGHDNKIFSLALSSNDKFIVAGDFNRHTIIWDTATGELIKELLTPDIDSSTDTVAISRDNRIIVTGGGRHSRQPIHAKGLIWDVRTGKLLSELKGHTGPIISVAISSDSRFVVTASRDGTARIWNAETGVQLKIFRGHENEINVVKISQDGDFIVSGSVDKTARIWQNFGSVAQASETGAGQKNGKKTKLTLVDYEQILEELKTAEILCGSYKCEATADGRYIYQGVDKEYWFYAGGEIVDYLEFEQAKDNRAISILNRELKIDPENAKTYLKRGNAYYKLRQYDNALLDYSSALRLDPKNASVYISRAYAYNKLRKTDKSEQDFGHAMNIGGSLLVKRLQNILTEKVFSLPVDGNYSNLTRGYLSMCLEKLDCAEYLENNFPP